MKVSSYTCLDCKLEFDEPDTLIEHYSLVDHLFEQHLCCPYCGGPFTQTHLCDECGEMITDTYIKLQDGTELCSNCFTVRDFGE